MAMGLIRCVSPTRVRGLDTRMVTNNLEYKDTTTTYAKA